MGQDGTITDALARRDVLRLRHAVVTAAARTRRRAGTSAEPSASCGRS